MMNWEVDPLIFKHPFTCFVAGPTQSGKTFLLQQILLENTLLIDPKIDRIIYCFSAWQPFFENLKKSLSNIEFNEGIFNIEDIDPNVNNLIVLDDLLKECQDNIGIQNLFTVDSHHKNISVFLLSQNLFPQGRCTRTISLNSHYLIIFNNPRDKSQIYALARQMFPNKMNFFLESFDDAVNNKAHAYLFLDFKQSTLEKNRVQTGILSKDLRIIYTPI
ncbi:unnamed protein product [Brachionus calyciflorus]|uniref:Uncharacterized protein n=1 Tax=Brachionus calyciflorus TaxID=104777 RepID=A0A814MWP5_9BILA|nr:unnamed protein product [Brachionus calyciflorus]